MNTWTWELGGFHLRSLSGLFNQPLEDVAFPDGLQHLAFGFYFNQSLQNLPDSLQSLTVGHDFKQSSESVQLPKQLQIFNFGGTLWPHANLQLPSTLRKLSLAKRFNQSLDDMMFPATLAELILAGDFNQPLDGVSLPEGLESLTLAGDFNQSLARVRFPESLLELKFLSWCLTFFFWKISIHKLGWFFWFNFPDFLWRFPGWDFVSIVTWMLWPFRPSFGVWPLAMNSTRTSEAQRSLTALKAWVLVGDLIRSWMEWSCQVAWNPCHSSTSSTRACNLGIFRAFTFILLSNWRISLRNLQAKES